MTDVSARVEVEILDAGDPSLAAAAAAHEVDQRLKANVRRMRGMWVELARDLYRFHESRLWADLGYETFEAYLADPELELERRWVYDSMAMYKQLVVERGVDPSRLQELQISKVREVLPAIRRELVTLDEALDDATTLRRVDLEQKYRGAASDGRTAGPDTGTEVRTEREPVWRRCEHCGSMYQTTPTE
jgi:hypothetical protein